MAETSMQVATQNLPARQSFEPTTLSEAMEFSKIIAESDLAPKDYRGKPANVLVAIQFGKELNVPPMQALQGIAVINGRPSVWGDLMWALVTTHPDFEDAKEEVSDTKAVVTLKRRGRTPVTVEFTKDDATKARLWDKDGPWKTYPKRQMQWRARTFAARDLFPDALKGMVSAEEAMDYDGKTIDAGTIPQTTPAQATAAPAQAEETIGKATATEWYKTYRAHGWTAEESKAFLKEKFGIEHPKTSADIPKSRYAEAEAWAKTMAPVRKEVEAAFEVLGSNPDERKAFFAERKGDWAKALEDLKAEVAKRDQQEQ